MSYLFPLKMKYIQMEPCQIMMWVKWEECSVALFDHFTFNGVAQVVNRLFDIVNPRLFGFWRKRLSTALNY